MERQKDPRSQEVTMPTLGCLLPGFSLQEKRKFSKEKPPYSADEDFLLKIFFSLVMRTLEAGSPRSAW